MDRWFSLPPPVETVLREEPASHQVKPGKKRAAKRRVKPSA
jgi:hypothetical protein